MNIEKLQGTSIKISTEDGLLKTKYLYAESSFLSSTAGDILLGSIHGKTGKAKYSLEFSRRAGIYSVNNKNKMTAPMRLGP